jgi:hypothetical protein
MPARRTGEAMRLGKKCLMIGPLIAIAAVGCGLFVDV